MAGDHASVRAKGTTLPSVIGSPRDVTKRVADVLSDLAGSAGDVSISEESPGVVWVSLVPNKKTSAEVEARIGGPLITLTIGEHATFEFPYWSAKTVLDDGCIGDIGHLVGAVVRGEFVEEWVSDVKGEVTRSSAVVGLGPHGAVTSRQARAGCSATRVV